MPIIHCLNAIAFELGDMAKYIYIIITLYIYSQIKLFNAIKMDGTFKGGETDLLYYRTLLGHISGIFSKLASSVIYSTLPKPRPYF